MEGDALREELEESEVVAKVATTTRSATVSSQNAAWNFAVGQTKYNGLGTEITGLW